MGLPPIAPAVLDDRVMTYLPEVAHAILTDPDIDD